MKTIENMGNDRDEDGGDTIAQVSVDSRPHSLKVVNVELIGGHYDRQGRHYPPRTHVTLSNGVKGSVPSSGGFDGALDWVDQHGLREPFGRHFEADTSEFRARLDVWVETGQFPPAEEVNA
jgi:hypothetical protein